MKQLTQVSKIELAEAVQVLICLHSLTLQTSLSQVHRQYIKMCKEPTMGKALCLGVRGVLTVLGLEL